MTSDAQLIEILVRIAATAAGSTSAPVAEFEASTSSAIVATDFELGAAAAASARTAAAAATPATVTGTPPRGSRT
ncbi:unannotated protein [freshwater metagenome]|uniref:Unannotated protein n=1 Tax=freshwater metagenome TaxID=449393 RepID=A0A6J7I8Q6_9ZZZZ